MSTINYEWLIDLYIAGIYTDCLAIVDYIQMDNYILDIQAALKNYHAVTHIDVTKDDFHNLLKNQKKNELMIISDLDQIEEQSNITFSLRSLIDYNKHRNLHILICLSLPEYKRHFHGRNNPFYLFCGHILVSKIPKIL